MPENTVATQSSVLRFFDRLGLPDLRRHPALMIALAVDAIGSGVSGPLILLYLTRVIGIQLQTAGLLLTVAALASLVVPVIVAQLTRRLSVRTIVIAAQLLQGVGVVGLMLARDLGLLAVAAGVLAIGQRAFWSSVFSLVAAAADAERDAAGSDRWFAASGMIQNAGFALGGLGAGALLLLPGSTPFVVALAVNAVSFFGSAVLFKLERRPAPAPVAEDRSATKARVWTDGRYLLLIIANTLFASCSVLLTIGLPVYALDVLQIPGWLLGPLLALNTVLGATCQGLGVRLTSQLRRATVLALAGGLWLIWGLLTASLTLVQSGVLIAGLVLAVLLYATAELLHAPASMSLASSQAPKSARESYLSWFQYSFAIASIASPSVFTSLTEVGPALPWLTAAAAAALAVLLTVVSVRREANPVGASS
jgi:MFS family permease